MADGAAGQDFSTDFEWMMGDAVASAGASGERTTGQGFLSLPYIASLVVEMENLKAREEHQQENHRIKAKQISDLEEAIKSQRADCVAYARHRSIMEQALKDKRERKQQLLAECEALQASLPVANDSSANEEGDEQQDSSEVVARGVEDDVESD